ncbi:MAG: RimK/LysX family protein [Thioalkalispiraceae bacterium]|jgi:hypothetical protein
MKIHSFLVAGLLLGGMVNTASAESVDTIGWIEQVNIHPQNLLITAKIDTGADNSSVHANDIEVYEKQGNKWVRFVIENRQGDMVNFDLPLVRMATIKRKGAAPLQRPIVNMDLCLGNTMKKVQINLADRDNFKYRMLIGRSYLKNQYLVNASQTHTIQPACRADSLAQNS